MEIPAKEQKTKMMFQINNQLNVAITYRRLTVFLEEIYIGPLMQSSAVTVYYRFLPLRMNVPLSGRLAAIQSGVGGHICHYDEKIMG